MTYLKFSPPLPLEIAALITSRILIDITHILTKYVIKLTNNLKGYNAFNVYRRELAPGTVSLTGDRAQGDDSKHWANSTCIKRLFWPPYEVKI